MLFVNKVMLHVDFIQARRQKFSDGGSFDTAGG